MCVCVCVCDDYDGVDDCDNDNDHFNYYDGHNVVGDDVGDDVALMKHLMMLMSYGDEWMWMERMRKQMRAPALLADSALNTGVHYGCPHHDDDDEFTPMPFVFYIDDDNATEYDGSDADCVSQLINLEI